jgi:hypothetical protein
MEADSLHKLDYSYQNIGMQIEPEHVSDCMLPLRRFMDVDDFAHSDEYANESLLTPPSTPARASQKPSKPSAESF